MVVEGLRPAAEAKRIGISVDIDHANGLMRGDGERLQQVIWNLVSNAIKFTPKGGTIRIGLKRIESDLEFRVTDDGEGIAPDFLPHVFESFRQSDGSSTRVHGGLGVGLSIVKHLVELHGGFIQAESEGKGLGSTFVVRLPISSLVSTTMGISRVPATKPEEESVRRSGTDLVGVRVLVVDDDEDSRDLVSYVLEGCGAAVTSVASADAALAAMLVAVPDVIVSDIGMPGGSGYSFIRSVRLLLDEKQQSVPAIALTAFAGTEDRARALVEGFNLHLAKPVEPAVLAAAVADLAGRRRDMLGG